MERASDDGLWSRLHLQWLAPRCAPPADPRLAADAGMREAAPERFVSPMLMAFAH